MIRYTYFALKQVEAVPGWLHWTRYSAFLVLYPVGISSEVAMTLFALFGPASGLWEWYPYGLVLVLLSYIPGEYLEGIREAIGESGSLITWFNRLGYPLHPHAEAAQEVPRGWQQQGEEDPIKWLVDRAEQNSTLRFRDV